jgi:hypothetical protein
MSGCATFLFFTLRLIVLIEERRMKNVVTYNETYKISALKLSLGLSRKSSVLQGVFFCNDLYTLNECLLYYNILN